MQWSLLFWLAYVTLSGVLVLLAYVAYRRRRLSPRWVHRRDLQGCCGNCGYNIRNLPGLTCPECGSDLRDAGWIGPGDRARRTIGPLLRFGFWTFVISLAGLFMWRYSEWRYLPVRQTFSVEAAWPSWEPLAGGVHITSQVEITAQRTLWGGLASNSIGPHEPPPGEWTQARIGLSAHPSDDPSAVSVDPALLQWVEMDRSQQTVQLVQQRGGRKRVSTWPQDDPATIEEAIRSGVRRLGLPSHDDPILEELASLFIQQRDQPDRPLTGASWRANRPLPIALATTHVAWARWAALAWWGLVWAAGLPFVLAPRKERWIAPVVA